MTPSSENTRPYSSSSLLVLIPLVGMVVLFLFLTHSPWEGLCTLAAVVAYCAYQGRSTKAMVPRVTSSAGLTTTDSTTRPLPAIRRTPGDGRFRRREPSLSDSEDLTSHTVLQRACGRVSSWRDAKNAANSPASTAAFTPPSSSAPMTTVGTVDLLKKRRGIINKICPEKYDVLLAKLLDTLCEGDPLPSLLSSVLDLVFDSVCQQLAYLGIFADVVKAVTQAHRPLPSTGEVHTAVAQWLENKFQELVLSDHLPLLDEELQQKAKSRRVGLVRFTGELCCKTLTTVPLITHWIDVLLYGEEVGNGHRLELVWQMLQQMGPILKDPRHMTQMEVEQFER